MQNIQHLEAKYRYNVISTNLYVYIFGRFNFTHAQTIRLRTLYEEHLRSHNGESRYCIPDASSFLSDLEASSSYFDTLKYDEGKFVNQERDGAEEPGIKSDNDASREVDLIEEECSDDQEKLNSKRPVMTDLLPIQVFGGLEDNSNLTVGIMIPTTGDGDYLSLSHITEMLKRAMPDRTNLALV